MKIITLLTDFGSFYPAQMKGVILSRLKDKDVALVDIAHDLPPQDVRAGALFSSLRPATFLLVQFILPWSIRVWAREGWAW